MSKHTPGPWKWKNASGAGLQIYGQVPFKADCVEFTMKASEQPLFTLVAYEKWIQFPPKEWDEMQEANAALIAAAPDLLAALEAHIAAVDAYYRDTPSEETIGDKCADMVLANERALKAIAKAKSKT